MSVSRVLLLVVVSGLVAGCSEKKAEKKPAMSSVPVAAPAAAKGGAKPAAKSGGGLMLGVPEAHLPPAGQCRIWKAGVSAYKQPQATSCDGITKHAAAGSMVLERRTKDPKVIRVRYIDPKKEGHVVKTRIFDVATRKYLKDG